MKATQFESVGKAKVGDVPKPTPGPGQILVKVHASALNPIDAGFLYGKIPAREGLALGFDYAGVVEAVGDGDGDAPRKVGDRVAGATAGGALAEYVLADPKHAFVLPDTLSFEDASTLGIGALTACQMLYQSQDLPRPGAGAKGTVLVWSAASAVGQFVVQLAALAGLRVIGTSSPRNFALVRSLGADAVFDYSDPNVTASIVAALGGEDLKSAHLCAGDQPALDKIVPAMPSGGIVSLITRFEPQGVPDNIKTPRSNGFTLSGQALDIPYMKLPAFPEHYTAAVGYAKLTSDLLAEGKLKTTPTKVFKGLESSADAFGYLAKGVSAEKVVITVP